MTKREGRKIKKEEAIGKTKVLWKKVRRKERNKRYKKKGVRKHG